MIKDLLEYWIRENTSEKLIDIRPDFYEKIREYLLRLTITELQDSNMVKNIKQREREFVKRMVADLILVRLTKILFLMREGEKIDLDRLPLEEQKFIRMIRDEIDKLFQVKTSVSEKESESHSILDKDNVVLIKFLKSYPQIKISENTLLGPFLKNDIAFLPRKIIEELIRKNIAKIIYGE